MVGIFKANNPLNNSLLFIYGLLLRLPFFKSVALPVQKKSDGILFSNLMAVLKKPGTDFPVIYLLLTYLLLFSQAVSFNRLVNKQRLTQRSTHLTAMSYLLITAMFAEWNVLSPALIINTLMIWVLARTNTLYNSLTPKTTLFNIGMVMGICAFLYLPSILFALLIIFALIYTRPFDFSEWMIFIVGIITPFYFLFAGLYLFNNLNYFRFPVFAVSYPTFHNYWAVAGIALLLITFFTGGYFVQANFRRQVVQVRNGWSLNLLYFVLAVIVPFANDAYSFGYWVLASIPLSAFACCAFLYPAKKWYPSLLHWLMVGFIIAMNYLIK